MRQGPYAEVIGDPVDHSLSPLIHNFWLKALGIPGEFRAVRVRRDGLQDYLAARRKDPDWRGCSVTAPLKEQAAAMVDRLSPEAGEIGAVNCLFRDGRNLAGRNSDVDGMEVAIGHVPIEGRAAVIIGSGGAARAAAHFLLERKIGAIRILSRRPGQTGEWASRGEIECLPHDEASMAMEGAALVINASPFGMTHSPPLPHALIDGLERIAPGGTTFDMVYRPAATIFLSHARHLGLDTVGGTTMLVGQARRAFRGFFGQASPRRADGELLELLTKAD